MLLKNFKGSSYNIEGYNDDSKSLLTILALTDEKSFEKNRKIIIYSILGIKQTTNPKEAIISLLQAPEYSGLGSLTDKETNAKRLADGILNGEITPYEATGIIKDHNPALKTKKMTELWTKLSAIAGLEQLKECSANKNWEEDIKNHSLNPRIKNLEKTLKEPQTKTSSPKDGSNLYTKKSYTENYPHLKESEGINTNWEEVISNLPTAKSGFIKVLLNSSSKTILKNEAKNELLFPTPSNTEVENKRLSKLIDLVGNNTNNRLSRYQRILLNLEEHRKPKYLPKIENTMPTASKAETDFVKRLSKSLEKRLSEIATQKSEEGGREVLMKLEILRRKKDIYKLRKINEDKAQELWLKYSPIIEEDNQNMPEGKLISKLRHGFELSPQKIINLIENKCTDPAPTPDEESIRKLLGFIDDLSPFKEKLKKPPFDRSVSIKNILEKTITEDTPKDKWGRGTYLAKCDITHLPYKLDQELGESKINPLTLACSTGLGEEEVRILATEMKSKKLSLDKKTRLGETPLHFSTPNIVKLLLKLGANCDIKNNKGETPDKTNPYPQNTKIIKEHRKQTKIKALLKEEIDSSITSI